MSEIEKLLRKCRQAIEYLGDKANIGVYDDLLPLIDAALSASAPTDTPKHSLLTVQKCIDEGDIAGARAEFNAGVKTNFGKQNDAALIDEIAKDICERAQPVIDADVVPFEVILIGAVKSALTEYAQRSAGQNVCMPREPTEEMIRAGVAYMPHSLCELTVKGIYKAMIEAGEKK